MLHEQRVGERFPVQHDNSASDILMRRPADIEQDHDMHDHNNHTVACVHRSPECLREDEAEGVQRFIVG
jgi:hypothetical protein